MSAAMGKLHLFYSTFALALLSSELPICKSQIPSLKLLTISILLGEEGGLWKRVGLFCRRFGKGQILAFEVIKWKNSKRSFLF